MKSGIVAIALIMVLIIPGCRNKPVKSSDKEAKLVRLFEAKYQSVSMPVHSTGVVASSEELKLSFKTGGIVADINVHEGQKVKKGTTLATLNLSEINAQVNLARNGFEKSTRDFNRVKNLYRDSVATLEQYQNTATALDVARSNLDVALFNQSHSTITAPDDGVVLKQFVRTNELVASGYPVFLFGTSGKNWKVKTALSDRDIVKINIGDSASVALDAWPGVHFSAIVDQVGEISNPMTGTYDIELAMKRNSYRLATGFIADVTLFPKSIEKYIMIPVGSIVDAEGLTGYVYTVNDSMIVRRIKIEIVTIIGANAAIKGDPEGFRRIVSEGAAYLRDGEMVKVEK
jgi:membrane fusion protein, multidrug efflux system